MQRRKAGFTLIELLVVVAIIAVLMSVLLPSLANAREQSKTVACIAKFREIGVMTAMYIQENDGNQPFSSTLSTTKDRLKSNFGDGIGIKAFSRNGTFCCPTLMSQYAQFLTPTMTTFNTAGLSDWFNNLSSAGTPLKTFKNVQRPADKGFLFDSYYRTTYNDFSWNTSAGTASLVTQPAHNGKRNCLYFDYHVETLKSVEMKRTASTTDLANRYWQPLAE